MTTVALTASARSDFGKGAARRIRREGQIPAVVYGEGTELIHIALPAHDLDLALRRPRVVLSVAIEGATRLVKPRDIQRDPVRRTLEHVDLVVITEQEAADRGAMAEAIKAATAAAEEAGMDAASAVQALEAAVASGEDPTEAAKHAVEDAEHKAEEYSEANAHEEAIEAAEAAEIAAVEYGEPEATE